MKDSTKYESSTSTVYHSMCKGGNSLSIDSETQSQGLDNALKSTSLGGEERDLNDRIKNISLLPVDPDTEGFSSPSIGSGKGRVDLSKDSKK